MIRGLHHVGVATGDIDRLVDFYQDLLGFELVSRGSWEIGSDKVDAIVGLPGSSARTAVLRANNLFLEVFQYLTPEGRPGDPNRPVADHGYTHICLDVIDVDAEHARLSAAGMRFHAAPSLAADLGGAVRSTYGRDPDGNVVELQEILDPKYSKRLDLA